MATYVMSDIHGCFDEFLTMIQKIKLSGDDVLYLAGDYIDRGNQSLEMLRWLENLPENIHPIMGNHEFEYIQYVQQMLRIYKLNKNDISPDSNRNTIFLYDEAKKTGVRSPQDFDYYDTIYALLRDHKVSLSDLVTWSDMMKEYPYFYRFPVNKRDCVIVHAGFCDDTEETRDIYGSINLFYLYIRQEALQTGGVPNGLIISGHTPTIFADACFFSDGRVFKYYDDDKDCLFYNIDCGLVYRDIYPSANMACIRLEDEKTFYLY